MFASFTQDKSKWAKSDDFEAEFFDRHRELTESLISRRSPLIFNPPPAPSPLALPMRASGPSPPPPPPPPSSNRPIDLNRLAVSSARQMAPQSQHEQTSAGRLRVAGPVLDSSSPTTTNSTDNSSVFFKAPLQADGRRPRPRSACLDTYMLRLVFHFSCCCSPFEHAYLSTLSLTPHTNTRPTRLLI